MAVQAPAGPYTRATTAQFRDIFVLYVGGGRVCAAA
jgi:hypothetical protein